MKCLAIPLGVLSLCVACAGDSDGGSGDSGSTAATDTGTASTSTTNGATASGSASASASGSSASTSDGDSTGTTSATSVDGSSGADTGSTAASASSDDGSGSTTGSAGACPGFGMNGLLLFSTLDAAAAVTSPTVGAGMGEIDTNPLDDFVPAQDADGLQIDADGEYLRFPVGSGGTDNIDFAAGTVDLCYQPHYDHTDDLDHPIFGTSDFQNGGIRVRKAASNNNNSFQVIVVNGNGQFYGQIEVPPDQYALVTDEWYRITVSWDLGVDANEPSLHAYIDGVEILGNNPPMGPTTAPSPASDELIYFGAFSAVDPLWNGNGVLDEVKIYGSALVP